jgi:hypothetical protein
MRAISSMGRREAVVGANHRTKNHRVLQWRALIEPFLGSGAMFFGVAPARGWISDVNSDLVNAFAEVRRNPEKIERELKKISVDRDTYYRIRSLETANPTARCVRLIYLNRSVTEDSIELTEGTIQRAIRRRLAQPLSECSALGLSAMPPGSCGRKPLRRPCN